jgi:hypothetical protein
MIIVLASLVAHMVFAHAGPARARKDENMFSKKMAIQIIKLSFCVATAIVIWAQPASLFADQSTALSCPHPCFSNGVVICNCGPFETVQNNTPKQLQ